MSESSTTDSGDEEALTQYALHLPAFGDDTARIVTWLVDVGEHVAEDQPLVVVAVTAGEGEVCSPVAGVVVDIAVDEEDVVAVGTVLAMIDTSADRSPIAAPVKGRASAEDPGNRPPAPVPEAGARGSAGPAEQQMFQALPLFDPFSPLPVETRLTSLLEGDIMGGDRLVSLRSLYEDVLLPAWTRFVDAADAWLEDTDAKAGTCGKAVKDVHERAVAGFKEDYRQRGAATQGELSAIQAELARRLKAGEVLGRKAWARVGVGLELPAPEIELERRRTAPDQDADKPGPTLAALDRQIGDLPQIPRASEDKTLQHYWWWAGIAMFAVGLGTGNLIVAIILGLAGGGAVFGMGAIHRSNAGNAYDAILDAIARDQAFSTRDLARRAGEFQKALSEAQKVVDRQTAASASARDTALKAIADARQAAIGEARDVYRAGVASFEQIAGRIGANIEETVAGASDLYAPWEALAELPDRQTELPYVEQVRFRVGETSLEPPRTSALSNAQASGLKTAGPWFWSLAGGRSLLFVDSGPSGEGRDSFAAPILTRILNQLPAGKAHLTLFDPLGLGRNFGAFMRLGDFSDQIINGRVWANADDIRQRLKDLIGHIERVTQKYLRNEHADIESYNSKAGEIAEAYRILVLADFPECFDEDILRDLLRILQNGPRCGVFVIMHANTSAAPPRGIDLDVLRPWFTELRRRGPSRAFEVVDDGSSDAAGRVIAFDYAPEDARTNAIVERYGAGAQKALKVEVPYQRLLELAGHGDGLWSNSSADGISVPLGPAGGKKKTLSLELGKGLCHHALLTGRPGSGKSNLLHVFITTAARLYSPEELQFYLVDFKQGVEFKAYAEARLPHARVIAVESEREFGLSVLQGLDAEMTRRGALFRAHGADNIADYRQKSGAPMPRIVLVIDEFQELFVRDDKLKREAITLIGRLVSQARYAGIHLLLGSQSLATATLERAVRDQMTVRIALQSSEADSRLILAEDNTAARTLTRPGEAIYNDDAGSLGGNHLFQVALFSNDDRRRELAKIAEHARATKWAGEPPIVFEGHEPGDITRCAPLNGFSGAAVETPTELRLWVGEPTALRPATAASLKRHAGRNVLILTRDEHQGVGAALAAMLSLTAQIPPAAASFRIVDLTSADAAWADHPEIFAESVPHAVEVTGRHEFRRVAAELEAEVQRRSDDGLMKEAAVFMVLLGAHRVRELKQDDAGSMFGDLSEEPVNVRRALQTVLRDGPEVGVHSLIWCDAYANLERALDRGGLGELGVKLAGPLSDQESRRLFDEDAAAHLDKPHRMVLGDDDRVGVLEVFRPYQAPVEAFLREFGARLSAAPTKPPRHARKKGS
ncbi:FtsK/SpoIIIE domain-containing protein [Brevundimonas sp.]|uniref:FtsK/SpoIIIE domain-containing protein n=1 Tax=Brevundimonas sp. TaxID=1871086 RepID=UPI002ED8F7EC